VIAGGTHRVTGGERITVECDIKGCPESLYLPPGNGGTLYDARTLMIGVGWQIERYKAVGPLAARCPQHTTPREL
jgi:hypothetical protein